MVAIIGGEPRQFAPLVDLYRRAGAQAGHSPEQLKVGLHVFGFVAESTQAAADTIYPGWEEMFRKVSRERGFAPPTRQQFDATSGPNGAFFMGDPQTVADKIARVSEQLGGVDRLSLQMTNPRLAHDDLLRGIELLAPRSRRWSGRPDPAAPGRLLTRLATRRTLQHIGETLQERERVMELEVTGGRIRGAEEGGIARFLGVPYAAAPFGERRMASPQPVRGVGRRARRHGVRTHLPEGRLPAAVPAPAAPSR